MQFRIELADRTDIQNVKKRDEVYDLEVLKGSQATPSLQGIIQRVYANGGIIELKDKRVTIRYDLGRGKDNAGFRKGDKVRFHVANSGNDSVIAYDVCFITDQNNQKINAEYDIGAQYYEGSHKRNSGDYNQNNLMCKQLREKFDWDIDLACLPETKTARMGWTPMDDHKISQKRLSVECLDRNISEAFGGPIASFSFGGTFNTPTPIIIKYIVYTRVNDWLIKSGLQGDDENGDNERIKAQKNLKWIRNKVSTKSPFNVVINPRFDQLSKWVRWKKNAHDLIAWRTTWLARDHYDLQPLSKAMHPREYLLCPLGCPIQLDKAPGS